jgi:hypothetical protein
MRCPNLSQAPCPCLPAVLARSKLHDNSCRNLQRRQLGCGPHCIRHLSSFDLASTERLRPRQPLRSLLGTPKQCAMATSPSQSPSASCCSTKNAYGRMPGHAKNPGLGFRVCQKGMPGHAKNPDVPHYRDGDSVYGRQKK